MSSEQKPELGSIGWVDLTVPDAEKIQNFYRAVVGWQIEPVEMGGYTDFNMLSPATGVPKGGICHARGVNANLPPQWLIYIIVENLEKSVEQCTELGGKIITPTRHSGEKGQFAVIQDPAGAVVALYEP
jgi:hypothetical protein